MKQLNRHCHSESITTKKQNIKIFEIFFHEKKTHFTKFNVVILYFLQLQSTFTCHLQGIVKVCMYEVEVAYHNCPWLSGNIIWVEEMIKQCKVFQINGGNCFFCCCLFSYIKRLSQLQKASHFLALLTLFLI